MEIQINLDDYSAEERNKIIKLLENAGWVPSFNFTKPLPGNGDTPDNPPHPRRNFSHNGPNPTIPDGVKAKILT